MNVCDPRHEQKYQITYKPAVGSNHSPKLGRMYKPTWLVCESCMDHKRHFGSEDEIESVEVLA